MAEKFTVGLIQMSCSPDPRENLAKAEARIREAAARGAQIICLQELFRSQYFCREENADLFELAEPIPGPSTEALAKLARDLNVVIVGSLFERRAAGIYHNTAVILDADGSLLGKYRKMHIPDDPLYYEKFYFTPGDLGFPNFDTRFGRIGVLVCWDQWYPEGARACEPRRRQHSFLSHGDWLASVREAGIRRGATRRVAHDSALARHRQRRVRRGRESRRLRRHAAKAASNSGDTPSSAIRSAGARRRVRRQGRNPDRRMRSDAGRRNAPQLAVPARPPHRCLLPHPGAMARVKPTARKIIHSLCTRLSGCPPNGNRTRHMACVAP